MRGEGGGGACVLCVVWSRACVHACVCLRACVRACLRVCVCATVGVGVSE